MPRTAVTPKAAPGSFPTLPVSADSLDLTFTAADTVNKNQFASSGNDLVIVQNSGASPYTFTLTSVADAQKRTGDITTYSLAAGEFCVVGPLTKAGWMQADGQIYIEGSNVAVKFAVIAL